MKLHAVGVLGILVAAAFSVGCNGSSQAKAKGASDVFGTMNAELQNAISTTTLTSEQMPLPESRMPVAQWEDDEAPAKPVQTWGVEEAPPSVDALTSSAFDRL